MVDAANESAMNNYWETQELCIEGLLRTRAERIPDAIAITAPGRTPLVYSRLWLQVAEVEQRLLDLVPLLEQSRSELLQAMHWAIEQSRHHEIDATGGREEGEL